jgi:hypothetical protein
MIISIKKHIAALFIAFYFSIAGVEGRIIYKTPVAIVYNIESVPVYFPKRRTKRNFRYEEESFNY